MLAQLSQLILGLKASVEELEGTCALLQLEPLNEREWFQLIQFKLLPQLQNDSFLVAAVVGGTNIGKSAIFNRIAGESISAVSPLASGTKHPVCLVPAGFEQRYSLDQIFQGFELKPWAEAEQALEESDTDSLYWRTAEGLPENLLVLDTPDIDSDAKVNWARAEKIRLAADVLVTVLTQQKYNDAVVKEFFRKAALEDKSLMVVFNQCQLPEDEEYWPIWLKTFCENTGAQPEYLYLAPNDRQAVQENRLHFYERTVPEKRETSAEPPKRSEASTDLTAELSQLKFNEIKLRSLRGALRHIVHSPEGINHYLNEVELRSHDFRVAAEKLSSENVAQISNWPAVPTAPLVQEIRLWWKKNQTGWARQVQSVYDTVGEGIKWPFRMIRHSVSGPAASPLEQYREQEWNSLLLAIENIYQQLSWMKDSASTLLQPVFERALEGKPREQVIERIKQAHEQFNLETEVQGVVEAEMDSFQQNSPELYKYYRYVNQASAAIRPVTSVVLFTMGWGPAGELVAPVAASAIAPIIVDFAGGAVTAVAGEQVVTTTAGSSLGFLQSKFHDLQNRFTQKRVQWLMQVLKTELLGDLPEELLQAAHLKESDEFRQVEQHLSQLLQLMQEQEMTLDSKA